MPTTAPSLPRPQLPGPMPSFIQANPTAIEQGAIAMDQQSYGLSDKDFAARYPQLVTSQTNELNQIQNQISGGAPPNLQNLWTRAGLAGATGATGNWSMGTGTPGMANVARNLGVNNLGYTQQLYNQFQTASDMFRPRTFGLSGADASQIALSNIAGQNNWNQADYAYKVQESQFAANMAAQQSVMSANASNAQTSNIVGGVSSVASIAVVAFGACWLARAVYGAYNPRWKRFRYWLTTKAPAPVRAFYLQHGPAMADWTIANSWSRPLIRLLMEVVTLRLRYAALPL